MLEMESRLSGKAASSQFNGVDTSCSILQRGGCCSHSRFDIYKIRLLLSECSGLPADLPVGPVRTPALWPPPPRPPVLPVSPPPTRSGTACPRRRSPATRGGRSRGRRGHNTSPPGDISLPSQRQFSQERGVKERRQNSPVALREQVRSEQR